MGGAGAARTMTWSLDKKRSYSTMHSTCLTMGTRPPSPPVLAAHSKPLHLCNVILRIMSLMVAMHLWELCTEVRGDSGGASDRVHCLLFVVMLLLFVMLLLVVVDVLVVVVL